jgi:pyruvate,water dikinase
MLAQKGATGGNVWREVKKTLRNKQKLAGAQIEELARLCLSIEAHYGHPQDIEWAYARGKFYITQSRPITTLTA